MIKIMKYNAAERDAILNRNLPTDDVSAVVAEIIDNVRRNKDAALFAYCREFDHADLTDLEVSAAEIDAAYASVDTEFINIMRDAAKNIEKFHQQQVRQGFYIREQNALVVGQVLNPIENVGLYVPGGTAAYPSTVLMNCIPAKLAGCPNIVMVTPASGGKIAPAILAAAKIAGVDRIFKVGGAQAIAALAYGTESIPRVDKIVGPGNAYVAEAKRQVFGKVAIDMIAGPSEILVVANDTCSPRHIAADLLSQAEHDAQASAVLVTDSAAFAEKVAAEIESQLPELPRADIARASIAQNGKIIVVDSLDVAVDLINQIAPEHVEICLDNPLSYITSIKNAGSIFLGKNCPEAVGDYFAGPNHTLPTGGSARFSSALSVDDFTKKTQYVFYPEIALEAAGPKIIRFAEEEGLSAHARSVALRLGEGRNGNIFK